MLKFFIATGMINNLNDGTKRPENFGSSDYFSPFDTENSDEESSDNSLFDSSYSSEYDETDEDEDEYEYEEADEDIDADEF